jgi:hypothetical protein
LEARQFKREQIVPSDGSRTNDKGDPMFQYHIIMKSLLLGAMLVLANPASGGEERPKAEELKKLIKNKDVEGLRKFCDGLTPRARRDVIKAYEVMDLTDSEREALEKSRFEEWNQIVQGSNVNPTPLPNFSKEAWILEKALDKLLGDLKKQFQGDSWDEEAAVPYELYYYHIIKGMKYEVVDSLGRKTFYDYQDWTIHRWVNLAHEPPKLQVIKQFLKTKGISSASDLRNYLNTGEPAAYRQWCDQYHRAFPVSDISILLLERVFRN